MLRETPERRPGIDRYHQNLERATTESLKGSSERQAIADVQAGRRRRIVCQSEADGVSLSTGRVEGHKEQFYGNKMCCSAPLPGESSNSTRNFLSRQGFPDHLAQPQRNSHLPDVVQSLPCPNLGEIGINAQDYELLHHYLHVTAFAMSSEPYKQRMWRVNMPEPAKRHEYLKHNLLGLAAVHNARIRPAGSQRYNRLAIYNQFQAAKTFESTVKNISEENCYAVCTSAGTTTLTELAYLPDPRTMRETVDLMDELLDRFVLVRKAIPLWRSSMPYMNIKATSHFYLKTRKTTLPQDVPEEVLVAARNLETLFEGLPLSGDDRESYIKAVKIFSWKIHMGWAFEPQEPVQALCWCSMVDEHFIELLKAKQPPALAILAHYCILISRAARHWYLVGWAETVFTAVENHLDEPWTPLLEWVKKAMTVRPSAKPNTTLNTAV